MLALAAGTCRETVSPSPMVRNFRFFFFSALSASARDMPVTLGMDTSTAADSSALYTFSMPI